MSKSKPTDLNKSTAIELDTSLKGTDPNKAELINKARQEHHGYKSISELNTAAGRSPSILQMNSTNISLTVPQEKTKFRNSAKSRTWPRRGKQKRDSLSVSPPRTRSHSVVEHAGVAAGLRSRKNSTALQNGTKQKRKVTKDGQSLSPEKKLCRADGEPRYEQSLSPEKKLCRADGEPRYEQSLSLEKKLCQVDGAMSPSPRSETPPADTKQQRLSSMLRGRIPSKTNPPPELAHWIYVFQSWTQAERLVALDQLVEICEPSEAKHLMSIIEPQFQRDFISLLPKELALHTLSFLTPRDLSRAAQTCNTWRILAADNLMWREKCREGNITEGLVYESHFGPRTESPMPFKYLYKRQMMIERNWVSKDICNPVLLRGHDDHVITCVEFCNDKIVSGSDDNTLKVWSAASFDCIMTLQGHTGGVWSSQMRGNLLISGSTDRSLKIWDISEGSCLHTCFGHTSTVRCLSLHGDVVVSGSRDASLRLWNIETGACLHVLQGHVAAVRCVQYDGRRVVSGAYDYMVKVWEPDSETCLFTLQGHTNRVYSLQFDGSRIVSGSLDTSIRVWDVETGQCLHTLVGHQSLTSGMELKDNILVSGNADSTVKIWDIKSGRCLQTLQGSHKHQSAVTCLQFSRKFVITSSDDGTVKLWRLETGEFVRDLVKLPSGGSGGVVWRIKATNTKLICAVGSRNGTEETKLIYLDFDSDECGDSDELLDDFSSEEQEDS